MMLSQKAYAAKKGVNPGPIKGWYEKGYLPGATRNDCTSVYEIPADTPVPYHGKGLNKVTKIPTLMLKLLEAASEAQSVFASMFPGIDADVFQRTLDGLIDGHKIDLIQTEHGSYIQITDEGARLKNELSAASNKAKETLNGIFIGTTGTVLGTLIIQAINFIATHPEWAQNLTQLLSTK